MPMLRRQQDLLDRNFRIAYLIGHFIQEDLTEEEEEELDRWMQESDTHVQLFEDLTDPQQVEGYLQWYRQAETERHLSAVKKRIDFHRVAGGKSLGWYLLAACMVGLAGFMVYFFGFEPISQPASSSSFSNMIQAGDTVAVLTLANGRRISLGQIADTSLSRLAYLQDGELHYHTSDEQPELQELAVPIRGFFKLVLPDGSKVWLNAASSIRYPSRFGDSVRRVTITGETYVEVAKDPAHPFIVTVGDVEVTALGTAFNINAYPENPGPITSLIEGHVRISNGVDARVLTPGFQLTAGPGTWEMKPMAMSNVTSWTQNIFDFKAATIQEVMRMAARWYGIQVRYEGNVTDHFTGKIDRKMSLVQFLQSVEATGTVHFQQTGDTVIVKE